MNILSKKTKLFILFFISILFFSCSNLLINRSSWTGTFNYTSSITSPMNFVNTANTEIISWNFDSDKTCYLIFKITSVSGTSFIIPGDMTYLSGNYYVADDGTIYYIIYFNKNVSSNGTESTASSLNVISKMEGSIKIDYLKNSGSGSFTGTMDGSMQGTMGGSYTLRKKN